MFKRQLQYFRVCLFLFLLFFPLSSSQATELAKLSLDDITSLGTKITTDPYVRFEGNSSVKISTLWPTTICLGEVPWLNVDATTFTYQAMVKCEKLEGTAFLEMWCHVGGREYFSRGLSSTVSGTMNWRTLQTSFILQAGQTAKKVTLNIVISGRGSIWIDDAQLLKEPLQ